MTLLACPRCGDLSPAGSTRCETCNAPLLVRAVSLYPDAPPPDAAAYAAGAGEAAQTRHDCRSGDTGATPQANGRLSAPLSPAVPLGMESPQSSELQAAIMRAHKGWATRFAPHLLEEWLH